MKGVDPLSTQFEDSRLKLTVALDEIRKSQGVEGFQSVETSRIIPTSQTAYVDPQTHALYWRALACWNPECPAKGRGGGPFLFTRECSHITAGADGDLVIGSPDTAEMMKPVNCPACKSDKYVRPYDLPEAIVRERELRAELNKTYAAYGKAAEKNLPMPSGLRPPGDIMKDLQALPRLFLVAEPGKVKQFEAFTAPVGAGLGGASTP